jgi:hypothetical protein
MAWEVKPQPTTCGQGNPFESPGFAITISFCPHNNQGFIKNKARDFLLLLYLLNPQKP